MKISVCSKIDKL